MLRDVAAFAHAIYGKWVAKMSGIIGVIFWAVSAVLEPRSLSLKWGFAIGGTVALLFACFEVWRDERARNQQLEADKAGLITQLCAANIAPAYTEDIFTHPLEATEAGEQIRWRWHWIENAPGYWLPCDFRPFCIEATCDVELKPIIQIQRACYACPVCGKRYITDDDESALKEYVRIVVERNQRCGTRGNNWSQIPPGATLEA